MFYLIYQTTNLLNGKKYVGKHITNNLDDGYLGSGLHLCRAVKVHGKEQFKREILFFCNSQQSLDTLEKTYIDESIIKDSNYYNLALGGEGGMLFTKGSASYDAWYVNLCEANRKIDRTGPKNGRFGKPTTDETKAKISKAKLGVKLSDSTRKAMSEGHKGKKFSLEHRQKLSEAARRRYHG